jgi:hypothetical protein
VVSLVVQLFPKEVQTQELIQVDLPKVGNSPTCPTPTEHGPAIYQPLVFNLFQKEEEEMFLGIKED